MTPASPTTGPVVAAQGLTRWFGADKAVDGVDLTVAAGEIHALVGLNGAGKTTLMKILLGMLRPDAGAARLFGEPVGDAGPQVWSQVGHLLETPFGYGELTPTENVIAAARLHGMDVSAARRRAAEMISELTLDRWADRRSRVLSLGNRQRLGLACALVHRPRLLILDEPTNGLDPMGVLELRRMLLSRSHERRRRGAGLQSPPGRGRQDRRPDHRDAPRSGHREPGPRRRRPGTPVLRHGVHRGKGGTVDAAIATEALKLRRSPVARTGWLTVVLGVPALTAALTAVARAGGDSQLAVKAAAMLTGTGLAGYLGIVGQVTTVAMLVTTGIVTAWCFGREFVDGTVAGLFAATVSRRRIAAAKFVGDDPLVAHRLRRDRAGGVAGRCAVGARAAHR